MLEFYTTLLIYLFFLVSQWFHTFKSFSNLHFLGIAFFYIKDVFGIGNILLATMHYYRSNRSQKLPLTAECRWLLRLWREILICTGLKPICDLISHNLCFHTHKNQTYDFSRNGLLVQYTFTLHSVFPWRMVGLFFGVVFSWPCESHEWTIGTIQMPWLCWNCL